MSAEELASRAVYALAAIQAIGEDVPTDHPMRHHVRHIKQVAERIISDSIYTAVSMADDAKQLVKDFDKAKEEGVHHERTTNPI